MAGSDPHGDGMSRLGALQVPVPALGLNTATLDVDLAPQTLETLAVY